jgi:hypothetical protein
MNAWFEQLNQLIALREAGELSEEEFQDHKKRLWQLNQDLDAFNKIVDREEKRFPGDDVFQMRLFEIQIENPDLDLAGREGDLLRMRAELQSAVEEAEARQADAVSTTSDVADESHSPADEAALLETTRELVGELRSQILVLRAERLDTDFWTVSNQIEDALYRNGSEPAASWHRRVLEQRKRLAQLG